MNVLIIRPGALGDTLMLVPALADLQGKAGVTLVGRSPGLYFVGCYVEALMDMEQHGWHRIFAEDPGEGPLPEKDQDMVIAFFKTRDRSLIHNLNRFYPEAGIHVFPSYPCEQGIHTAFHLAGCLKSAGLPIDHERCIRLAHTTALLARHPPRPASRTIIFHPGSGSIKKNFSPGFWVMTIDRIIQDSAFSRYAPFVLLGPAEEHLYGYFCEPPLIGESRIISSPAPEELKGILESAALVIGHDSGITHLSAMLGAPTVALFKKNNIPCWRPLGPKVRTLHGDEETSGLVEKISRLARSV